MKPESKSRWCLMCHSMRVALKILANVADLGFDKTKPEDQEKRSSLIRGLFMNKYDRAKLAPIVDPLRNELPLTTDKPEVMNVQTETKPVPAE